MQDQGSDSFIGGSGGLVLEVVRQHAEESASLRSLRSRLVRAAHVRLRDLARADERLAAHMDGLSLAGECSWRLCEEALERAAAGEVFVATVRAIEDRNVSRLRRLFALALAVPSAERGLISAFGWVSPPYLRGTIKDMLNSADLGCRRVGIAACAMHRVDPGLVSACRTADSDPLIRARVLRAVGELGRQELACACTASIGDEDPACQFWAVWSAVLLGDRNRALDALTQVALAPGPLRALAYQLVLSTLDMVAAHCVLQTLAADPEQLRWLLRGSGIAGDPAYVPWLIGHMRIDRTARLAGEAFSLVTGTDLAWIGLDRQAPEEFEPGPNEDPDDSRVDMDEDDGLPWPDSEKVQAWWNANSHRFQPGVRYFMGQPLNRENCLRVLKEGYQRQRIAAALYLSLLNPGTPLFEWRAPAWRQQRLLAQMT